MLPRKVYESKLVGTIKRSHFSNFFSGSGAFIDTEPNTFDALIVDEAHRLNEKSGLYGNLGENQIKELIDSAKCSIFFIDEDQRVTLNDIGSKQAIRSFAKPRALWSKNTCCLRSFAAVVLTVTWHGWMTR